MERKSLRNLAEERIKISERFSVIKNEIDIDAETLLLRISNESMTDRASNIDYRQCIQAINDSRANLISEIEAVSKFILDKHSKMPQENISLDSRTEYHIFTDHCLYFDTNTVKDLSSNKYRLGLLIKTDIYISEIQAEYLK